MVCIKHFGVGRRSERLCGEPRACVDQMRAERLTLGLDVALRRMVGEEAELRTWRPLALQLVRNYLRLLSKGLL